MSAEVDLSSLMLEQFRQVRASLAKLDDGQREIKVRLTRVEDGLIGIRRDLIDLFGGLNILQHEHDRHTERIERIERRLELLPAEETPG